MGEPEVTKGESQAMKNLIVALALLAITTMVLVVRDVAGHWTSYSAMRKFSTIVLVSGIVFNPLQEIRAVKRGASDSRRLRAAVSWSSLLTIATLVFSTT